MIAILDTQSIQYMLSGSLALNVYSLPRMTRDIDLIVEMKSEDVENFVKAFKDDFYCYQPSIEEEVAQRGIFNLIDNQSSLKIDFIVRKNTIYRRVEFDRRIKTNTLGFEAWVVSIEDLIISKLIWIQDYESEKQINDIKNLLENPSIDFDYIQKWTNELNLKTFNLL